MKTLILIITIIAIVIFLSPANQMTFIKWVGGKSKHLNKILPKFPTDTKDMVYVEPFIGSGSVLIEFLKTKPKIKSCICSDANRQLITTFRQIKRHPNELITRLSALSKEYKEADNKENLYYEYRGKYNNEAITDLETAAVFIFLNKTCFRGLYRLNKDNKFNVPFGHYKNPQLVDTEYIATISELFKEYHVKFTVCGYQDMLANLNHDEKYLIYLDPPYLNTFDSYTINKFNTNEFIDMVSKMNTKNNKLVVSNSEDFYKENPKLLPYHEVFNVCDKINSKMPDKMRTEVVMWN